MLPLPPIDLTYGGFKTIGRKYSKNENAVHYIERKVLKRIQQKTKNKIIKS